MSTFKGCGHGKGKATSVAPHISLTYGNAGSLSNDFPSSVHLYPVTGSYSTLAINQTSMLQPQFPCAPSPYDQSQSQYQFMPS